LSASGFHAPNIFEQPARQSPPKGGFFFRLDFFGLGKSEAIYASSQSSVAHRVAGTLCSKVHVEQCQFSEQRGASSRCYQVDNKNHLAKWLAR
jgi:hypothetical protein